MGIIEKNKTKVNKKKKTTKVQQKDKTNLIYFKSPLVELVIDYLKINQMEVKEFCKKFQLTQKEFLSLVDPVCDVPFQLVADVVKEMGYELRIEL